MPPEVEELDLSRSAFRVGEWVVQPSLNRLVRGETTIQLELKVMDVLVCLAGRAGEVVSRRELTDRVWATEFISDNTVSHAVAELRAALGDDAREPTYIETIHRRGYRLIAAVETVAPEDAGRSKVARFPSIGGAAEPEDERSPYPGLSAFTEEDAEIFFGREAEVARMWRKLTSRRLLAVIGPSGVGKSSFLRAGVIPACPERWSAIVCQPGEGPFGSLARALVPEFVGDIEATAQLVDFRDSDRAVAVVSRWRGRHGQALLVVDQFEELFTQNPPGVQAGFAGFLRKLVDDADVHVVLAMRDDFLYRCQSLESMRPVFDGLLPLEQPDSEPLRRALVEPARRRGYAFEDDELAAEMVAEVAGERGALPMLAFAVARLWERRDRERRLLTRQAYAEIGKVGGALAKHAEATLTALGDERLPIVRELFRNLVTAEGTRAVREWHELLSIFPDSRSESGAAVLRSLIDARLLTSYELREEDRAPTRRVEVVHETLLTSWPRLVRWQTQDADAAQLRDQLRQAARTWDEHERTDDMLWTGSAYREFAVWRERYPGGLSELEEAFSSAMTSLANRRRRRRRVASAAALAIALAVAVVFGTLWRRSVLGMRHAEAAKLLALAELNLSRDPTEALAYAAKSLEFFDTGESRTFALKALWKAPTALGLDGLENSGNYPRFSPDGKWLATTGVAEDVLVFGRHGGLPLRLPGHTVGPGSKWVDWASPGLLVTGHWTDSGVRVWSIPDGRLLRTIAIPNPLLWQVGDSRLLAEASLSRGEHEPRPVKLVQWILPDGEAEVLGMVDFITLEVTSSGFSPSGRCWFYTKGDSVFLRHLPIEDGAADVLLGHHENDARLLKPRWAEGDHLFRPQAADGVWSEDVTTGEMKFWPVSNPAQVPPKTIQPPSKQRNRRFLVRESNGRWRMPFAGSDHYSPMLWDVGLLAGARPSELSANVNWYVSYMDLHPENSWLVASANGWDRLVFWPLHRPFPSIVEGYENQWKPVEFSPDGEWLVSGWDRDSVQFWPLPSNERGRPYSLDWRGNLLEVVFDATGDRLITPGFGHTLSIVSKDGCSLMNLEGFSDSEIVRAAAFSPEGRFLAAATYFGTPNNKVLRVWDLSTGEVKVFDLERDAGGGEQTKRADSSIPDETSDAGYENGVNSLFFESESVLLTAGWGGTRRWDPATDTEAALSESGPNPASWIFMTVDRTKLFEAFTSDGSGVYKDKLVLYELKSGTQRELFAFPEPVGVAIDGTGSVLATSSPEGIIRVRRIQGGETHLLIGHDGRVADLAISPDLRWIASAGHDGTLRLWPMPDLSKPPLHALPHDELLAKLKSLTNLRAVRDPESATGWKIEVGPFPGWAEVPEW